MYVKNSAKFELSLMYCVARVHEREQVIAMDIFNAADFGNAVRAYRKKRGYTQQELADYSGCSLMYISNLERGKETAELGLALRVLATLSVDLRTFDRRQVSHEA